MVDWVDLIFVWNGKLFQTAHILMKGNEKESLPVKRNTHTKKVEGGCGGWVSETDTEKASDSTHPSPSAQLFPSKSTTTSSIGNLHF